jgi:hypothetical protein
LVALRVAARLDCALDSAVADHVLVDGVLEAWGPLRMVGRLGGGNRNEVLDVRLGDQRLVARRSRRSVASLASYPTKHI